MSTQLYRQDRQAADQNTPRKPGGGPSWLRIWSVVIGTAVAVALIALATVTRWSGPPH